MDRNIDVNFKNKLEKNMYYRNGYEHQMIESSLLSFVDELLKSKLIVFRNGEYSLDY